MKWKGAFYRSGWLVFTSFMFSVNSDIQWLVYWWPKETQMHLLAYSGLESDYHEMRMGENTMRWKGLILTPQHPSLFCNLCALSDLLDRELFASKGITFFWGRKRWGNGQFALASGNLWFWPLSKLLILILEAKEIKSYIPEATSKPWNWDHIS